MNRQFAVKVKPDSAKDTINKYCSEGNVYQSYIPHLENGRFSSVTLIFEQSKEQIDKEKYSPVGTSIEFH